MASTSSVAAAASRVVPFHCVICFDEFNLSDRTPMVLPCGHTYVCNACTKRLKRCMECREPLFWNPSASVNVVSPVRPRAAPSRYGRPHAHSHSSSASSPPPIGKQNPEPVPLPISRNVVMIAMMEAAQAQLDMLADMELNSEEIEEETEARRILAGIETLSGPCGTYAVNEQEGLAVLPQDPCRKSGVLSVSSFPQDGNSIMEPFEILKGQTVQIVEANDGVYKLARNAGYIVATDSQLVKVGGPLDDSCKLEGMLNLVQARKKELEDKMEEIQCLSTSLLRRISETRQQEPSHPIISHLPEAADEDVGLKTCDSATSVSTPLPKHQREVVVATSPDAEHEFEIMDGDSVSSIVNLVPRTPNTIDNSDIIRTYADENMYPGTTESHYMCSPFSFFSGSEDSEERHQDDTYILPGRSFEEQASRIRPRIRRSLAPAIAVSPSMGSVDFSTGLSGHRALTSSKTGRGQVQRQVRMMSEHRGIGTFRGPLRRSQQSPGANAGSGSSSTGPR